MMSMTLGIGRRRFINHHSSIINHHSHRVLVEQSGVLATLSTWRSRVQIPSRALKWHGTRTGIAAKLKPWCLWVRLPPVLLEHASVGHWQAPLAVNQSSLWTLAVQLRPAALLGRSKSERRRRCEADRANLAFGKRLQDTARSSNGSGCETLILAIRVRLPYGLLVMAKWRNR
jgi:hypothetical protein